jgi:HSP20 family protein
MNLVRWTPFHDMTLLQNHMNRLFDGALQSWPGEVDDTRNWVPPADIHETDNDLIVTTDLPGVDPKNIDVGSRTMF